MSVSPERRFATSPEHEMLKKVFKKTNKTSLREYKVQRRQHAADRRLDNLEDQLCEMTTELNLTRERVDSISRKLDLILQHVCKEKSFTMFNMEDV